MGCELWLALGIGIPPVGLVVLVANKRFRKTLKPEIGGGTNIDAPNWALKELISSLKMFNRLQLIMTSAILFLTAANVYLVAYRFLC